MFRRFAIDVAIAIPAVMVAAVIVVFALEVPILGLIARDHKEQMRQEGRTQ